MASLLLTELTDDCIDTTELLEHLNATGNQETPPRLDRVAPEDILPSSLSRRLVGNGFGNGLVESLDYSVVFAGTLDACQYRQTLF